MGVVQRAAAFLSIAGLLMACGGDSGATASAKPDGASPPGADGGLEGGAPSSDDSSHDRAAGDAAAGDATAATGDDAGDGGIAPTDAGPVPPPPELTWKLENSPNGARSIWGSGPSDIYVVGGGGLIAHSTGDGQWPEQVSNIGGTIGGVWGSGPNDIYAAVDENVILHSTGNGTWDHQVLPSGDTFLGVWGSGPGDVCL